MPTSSSQDSKAQLGLNIDVDEIRKCVWKAFVYVLRNLYRQFPVRFRFDCYLTELGIVQLNIPEKVEFIPSDFKFRLALWKKYFYFWQVLVHVRHNVGHYHARLHTGGTFLLSP